MIRNLTLFIVIAFTHNAFAQDIFLTRTGSAGFLSDAPLEIIKAESKEVHGIINLDDRTFIFTIDNKSFKGFNSTLQQDHFYENYMEIQLYPVSSFKGKIIEEIDLDSELEQEVRAKGILDIHGVSQERIIKGTLRIAGNKLFVNAVFTVLLNDHQMKIPRVVNQKIAESLEVTISAELDRKAD